MSRPNPQAESVAPGMKIAIGASLAAVVALAAWLAWTFLGGKGPGETAQVVEEVVQPVETITDTQRLLQSARQAVGEQRIVEPPGNNAIELYLRLLELDPQNTSARTALLELMPYATDAADRLIGRGDYEGAARAIELLNDADPGSTIISTLANRLQRTRAQAEAQQLAQEEARQRAEAERLAAQQAAAQAAQPVAAPAPPAVAATQTPPPGPAATGAATPASPAPTPATPAPAVAATPDPATPPPAPAAAAPTQTRDFELVRRVNAQYPQRALRQGLQGWVDLRFTITEAGDVENIEVVNAQPRREFDREAVRALQQWKFRPRVENGRPVRTTAQQRIEFKLSG